MKENDKEIENLIERMMSENTLESPSFDFTSKIMSQVLEVEKSKIRAYKPLISKSAWVFISIILIMLIAYSVDSGSNISNFELTQSYSDKISTVFSGIHFSTNVLYGLLVIPFMVLIQIGVLKNYFDKKYEL